MKPLPSLHKFSSLFVTPIESVHQEFSLSPQEIDEYNEFLVQTEMSEEEARLRHYVLSQIDYDGESLALEDDNANEEKLSHGLTAWETYDVLNELRHKYAGYDEEKSMAYADRLLSGFHMDEYTLDILSDWHLGKNDHNAARVLLTRAVRFSHLYQIRAVCLIRAAQIYEQHGNVEEAG